MKTQILMVAMALAVTGCAKKFSPLAPEYSAQPAARPIAVTPTAPKPTVVAPVATSTLSPSSPEYFSKNVGDRVLFEVDQYTLNGAGKAVLDGQLTWLKENPAYNVVIEGHADEQGTREYNLALGARRAQAVRDYLVANGIPAARVRTLSLGKERPIEVCSEENCYAKNRRAVSVLAGGLS